MPNSNSVNLMGHMVRDPELKYLPNKTAVCEFSICVNKSKKVGDKWESEGHFFDCVAFKHTAEAANVGSKGAPVSISGRLEQQKWKNKEGQNRSRIVVVVDQIVVGLKTSPGGKHEQPHDRSRGQSDDPVPHVNPNDPGAATGDDIPF